MEYGDRIKDTTSTVGTGSFVLGNSAPAGFTPFATSISIGGTTPYCAFLGTEWEIGIGTLVDANTMSRSVLASSNANALVAFSAGVKSIFNTAPASVLAKMVLTDAPLTTALLNPDTSYVVLVEGTTAKRISWTNLLTSGGVAPVDLPTTTTMSSVDYETVIQSGVEKKILVSDKLAYYASQIGTADTTPPVLSSPVGTQTGSTTASGSVTTNEANGTLYNLATTNATETAATVKATGATQAISNTGSKSVTSTGLTAATVYYMHFVHRDIAGNDSTVANSASFTTAAAPDTTAPTLSSPLGTQTGSTTANGGVTTDEANGTLYFLATTNATETAATVKASGGTQAITTTGAKTCTFTGLTASTVYYAHYVHRDASNNDSTVSNSASFTTAAADTTAPVLTSPLGTQTGGTTASGGVTTDEANGTLYFLASTNATETAAAVKASGGTQTITTTGAKTVSFTGLTVSTTYYAHYVHRDLAGNDSTVSNSTSFTTTAGGSAPSAGVTSLAGTMGDDSITLTWVNASGGTGWRVEQSPAGANTWTASTIAVAATSTGAKVGGLAGATNYDFRVIVFNSNGDGPATTITSKTTLATMTVTGYSGNTVKTTTSAVTPSTTQGSLKGLLYDLQATSQYWSISNSPTSAKCGWGASATVPPAEIPTSGAGGNVNGGSSVNGMSPMSKPGQFTNDGYLWVTTGSGTTTWYFWVLPLNGHAQCMNPSGMTVTGA